MFLIEVLWNQDTYFYLWDGGKYPWKGNIRTAMLRGKKSLKALVR